MNDEQGKQDILALWDMSEDMVPQGKLSLNDLLFLYKDQLYYSSGEPDVYWVVKT